MKVISILNLKGGVGKTFTTIQMADQLANRGYKVLLIDNDKQGNLSKFYGTYENNKDCPVGELLEGRILSFLRLIEDTEFDNISIISANLSLLTSTLVVSRSRSSDQHMRYARLIEALEDLDYDFCLIDNPPDMGINVVNALMASDDVIVPLRIDEWGLEGLNVVIEQIEHARNFNKKIKFSGCLVTHYKNTNVNKAGIEWLEQNNYKFFKTVIRLSDVASESAFMHTPICKYNSRCGLAVDYRKFVKEFLGGANAN